MRVPKILLFLTSLILIVSDSKQQQLLQPQSYRPFVDAYVQQENFDGLKFASDINKALQSVYPVNIFETLTNLSAYNDDNYADITTTTMRSASSAKCNDQVKLLLGEDGLKNGSLWALKMLDASSKIPSGILMGNRIDLGMYDECIDIVETVKNEDIQGRHCMYKVKASLGNVGTEISLSICLPSSCEPKDIEEMLALALQNVGDLLPIDNLPINVTGATCSSINSPDWTIGGIITLLGFSLLLLFLVFCTILDIFLIYTRNMDASSSSVTSLLDLLIKFSIFNNALRILDTKISPTTLPALQGIRFFSMCWVIFGHEYFMSLMAATVNPIDFLKWVSSWSALYILIAPFAVDTFFTLSGFLMGYLFLKEMSGGRRFNLFAYYIHRYLRLTPALAALILITIFVIPRIGSGAVWESSTGLLEKNCRHNWWPLMLYVQNYVDKEHLWCLAHTWYLAVEMHYFWISPLILYPLARKPKIGLVILAIAFVASIATPTVTAYQNKYSSFLFVNAQMGVESLQSFYMDSRNRAAPWLIGIFVGYLVYVQRGSTRKMIRWVGWISTIVAFLYCFFSMRTFQAKDYEYNVPWEMFNMIVMKPLWSGAVGWIIYASINGFGGPIGTFLSLPIFHPFSRISYSMYLVHFMIQFMKVSAFRTPRYFSQFNLFNEFLSDFILCVVVGLIFTLIFESPILILEKIITKRDSGRRRLNGSKQQLKNEKFITKGIDNPGAIVTP